MKLMVVSSAAVPSPVRGYGGLENITGYFAIEAAKRGHDVTLVTAMGTEIRNMPLDLPNLKVLETIEPSWENDAEFRHFNEYQKYMQDNFGQGEGIVWDNTWLACPYLVSMSTHPKMKVVHTHHGMIGFPNPPPVPYPMWMGVGRAHAALMASQMKIPVRHIHNGIYLPSEEQQKRAQDSGYLLSLNRISSEKGIHHVIDIAIQNKKRIIIAGDDTRVADQRYVASIIRRCRESNGIAEFYGLIDPDTKATMLQNCSAIVACPEPSWMEAFGLFAVEAMAYGKPVLAVANGGLAEIVESGRSGYLASTPEALVQTVNMIPNIKPEDCRARAAQFTMDIMTDRYLEQFRKILEEGDRW